jgi:hypothetical protein
MLRVVGAERHASKSFTIAADSPKQKRPAKTTTPGPTRVAHGSSGLWGALRESRRQPLEPVCSCAAFMRGHGVPDLRRPPGHSLPGNAYCNDIPALRESTSACLSSKYCLLRSKDGSNTCKINIDGPRILPRYSMSAGRPATSCTGGYLEALF